MKLYQKIAQTCNAFRNADKAGNVWATRHLDTLSNLADELPHGSGIDGAVTILADTATDTRFEIAGEYHCLNEDGYYDGWVSFVVVVKASLSFGCDVSIRGRFGRYGDVKEYLGDIFHHALTQEVAE